MNSLETPDSQDQSCIVETQSGQLQGKVRNNIFQFSGIPYAAPPVENLRFKAATPHPSWSGIRAAVQFSPAAPQLATGGMTANKPVQWDEDCLYLNVTTPGLDQGKRPVMVWIHGGNFRTGQAAIPWYKGQSFASQGDIVVVSINYRMGLLGFADLSRFGEDYKTSGANGILDQIRALEWVQNNIDAFGGDPDQVCIAGESAGAFSVGTLLASPMAKGLFSQAIAQSGAAHNTLPVADAAKVTDRLLDRLGLCDSDDAMAELQTLDVDSLLLAQTEIDKMFDRRFGSEHLSVNVSALYPAQGNKVVPQCPFDAIKSGAGREVNLLIGSNKDEATLFGLGGADEQRLLNSAASYGGDKNLVAAYRNCYPDKNDTELNIQMSTDHGFRVPAIRMAEAHVAQGGSQTWMYFFSWQSRRKNLGATHALEIPFVFNNLDQAGVEAFIGPGESPQPLADTMHSAWINFICAGDPGWQPYDLEHRANMKFDTECELLENLDDELIVIWQGLR